MNLSAPSRALVAGAVWLAAGLMLLWRGLFPYWQGVARDSATEAFLLLVGAVLLGAAKGWFVLRRSAARVLHHIDGSPARAHLTTLYPRSAYPLLLGMILLGVTIRATLGETLPAVVAAVYLGIGAALLCSAAPYFRYWRRGGFAASPGV